MRLNSLRAIAASAPQPREPLAKKIALCILAFLGAPTVILLGSAAGVTEAGLTTFATNFSVVPALIVLMIARYFPPTTMATGNKHPKAACWVIFAINFYAGWTVVGWRGAMLFAFMPAARK